MGKSGFTILLIEKDKDLAETIKNLILDSIIENPIFLHAQSFPNADEHLKATLPDIVVLNISSFPVTLKNEIKTIFAEILKYPLVILCETKHSHLATRLLKKGAQHFLTLESLQSKTFSTTLLSAIEQKKFSDSLLELNAIKSRIDEGIVAFDSHHRIIDWSVGAKSIYGFDAEDVLEKSILDFFGFNERAEMLEKIEKVNLTKKTIIFDIAQLTANKEKILTRVMLFPIKTAQKILTKFLMIVRDVSEEKFVQQQLGIQFSVTRVLAESLTMDEAAKNILKNICNVMDWDTGEIWAVDPFQKVLRCVSFWSASREIKESTDFFYKMTIDKGVSIPGIIWENLEPYWVPDIHDPKIFRKKWIHKFNFRSSFGFPILFHKEAMGVMLFFSQKEEEPTTDIFDMFRAISDEFGHFIKRKRMEGDLLYLAHHDSLTSLPNRFVLEDKIIKAVKNANMKNSMFALLYCDLDNFKKVNDSFGHEAGDFVLREVALRLKNCLRRDDFIARAGGDEFVILMEKFKDAKNIEKVAQKILKSFSDSIAIDGKSIRLTVSIGISIYPKNAEDETALIKAADKAMYRAKRKGGNTFEFY